MSGNRAVVRSASELRGCECEMLRGMRAHSSVVVDNTKGRSTQTRLIMLVRRWESRNFPKFTDHTQKFPKSYRVPAKILRKCVDGSITKIPRKSADELLLVVQLLIHVGKHQTELTVKSYICGSEKAQKFAGSLLGKFFRNFSPFGLRTWEKPK